MRNFLLFLAALLLAFILINYAYVLIFPQIDWNFKKAKEAYSFQDEPIEIIVLGNSTAMDGINTEVLSTELGNAYNFAIGGATLQDNYLQLKHHLANNPPPNQVFLFLSSCHLKYWDTDAFTPIIEYYYRNQPLPHRLSELPLYKYRWLFVENFKKLLSSDHRTARVVKGQLRIDRVIPDYTSIQNANQCLPPENYLQGYDHLWKIQILCKEKDIAFRVFEMPCWQEDWIRCEKGDIVIDTLGKELIIENLNSEPQMREVLDPSSDWLSENHLNYQGSKKLTNYILEIVQKEPLSDYD